MDHMLNYLEIMEMAMDDNCDNEEIVEKAQSAIIQQAKSSYDKLKTEANKFFNYIDNNVDKAVNMLKKASKDTKVKMSANVKKAMASLDKTVPDMLTNMNKYTKNTVYGKTTLIASNIAGWTVPPLIPIAGASEVLFTVAETVNYLLEFKRRWSGSNRSAINDFAVRCAEASDKIDVGSVGAEKTCRSVLKVIGYASSLLKHIVDNAMIFAQGKMIAGYANVYSGTEKLSKAVANKTKDSGSKVGNKIYKFSNKLNEISSDLSKDAATAKGYEQKYKEKKKELKARKKEVKSEKKVIKKAIKAGIA